MGTYSQIDWLDLSTFSLGDETLYTSGVLRLPEGTELGADDFTIVMPTDTDDGGDTVGTPATDGQYRLTHADITNGQENYIVEFLMGISDNPQLQLTIWHGTVQMSASAAQTNLFLAAKLNWTPRIYYRGQGGAWIEGGREVTGLDSLDNLIKFRHDTNLGDTYYHRYLSGFFNHQGIENQDDDKAIRFTFQEIWRDHANTEKGRLLAQSAWVLADKDGYDFRGYPWIQYSQGTQDELWIKSALGGTDKICAVYWLQTGTATKDVTLSGYGADSIDRLVPVVAYRANEGVCSPRGEPDPELEFEVRKNGTGDWTTLPDDGDLSSLSLDPDADTLNIQVTFANDRNMKYPAQVIQVGLEYTETVDTTVQSVPIEVQVASAEITIHMPDSSNIDVEVE